MYRWKEKPPSAPILIYIPVIHKGYLEFFERYREISDELWLIGEDLAAEFSILHTEIRAIDPSLIREMLIPLNLFQNIEVLSGNNIAKVTATKLVTVSERVSHSVVEKYFPQAQVMYDTVFLRYDENNVKSLKPVGFNRESHDPFDLKMMSLAYNEADKSSCWWRHVGTVLVKDGGVIATNHNEHVPDEQMPYVFGDPRDFIEAGKLSHFASSLHSEMMALIEAMRKGIRTTGMDIYVSVFPCPNCAKVIAYSGIKRCFFGSGHASLDGERILKEKNVELIYVPL